MRLKVFLTVFVLLLMISCQTPTPLPSPSPEDPFVEKRRNMVEMQIKARGVKDERVLAAMEKVPRHLFVPQEYLDEAYDDHPLPIGYGQTISQPYIVAYMTELLNLKPGDKVLEIGTGSGYQAAILAEITDKVYTVEIIPELARSAEERLRRLGYDKIKVLNADGYYGWEEHAPYDAIIVTCAPDHIPQPLVQQLKDGGRMVIPVGPPGGFQTLWLVEKVGAEVRTYSMMGVIFVPMLGGH
ncbi:MAG: protein-L-isoaspartate(D-aspartate) O-methyltransferase [Anaerolineae bacterium]|nr:protein-L-isoaspartate(D-aspartate) O-methyltransferase [Anaerolineae bacterium]